MLFSRRLGRYVSGRKPSTLVYEDPYAPGSRAYAERHRETVTELPSGLRRVDVGEPVKRLPCEAPAVRRDKAPQPAPAAPPPVPPAAPATAPVAAPKAPRKAHRAITRDA
jgi:hypothetical protein